MPIRQHRLLKQHQFRQPERQEPLQQDQHMFSAEKIRETLQGFYS